jgi:hypothetical protein
MDVNPALTQRIDADHQIEIGGASWDSNETSIRRRYDNPDSGRFSPYGSSELPLYALEDLIRVASENDILDPASCSNMISSLAASLARLAGNKSAEQG